MISDFLAEICELEDEEIAVEHAARVAHVQNGLGLDPVKKRVGKLLISRDLLDTAIKNLKRGKGSPHGCVAEVYHALPPSARGVLLLGLQDNFDTLSFPTEWTDISATIIPKCAGPQSLKDYRPLASLSATRKLSGHVWMLSLPRELPWRSFQAAFLPGRDTVQVFFLVQRCCEAFKEWRRPLFCAQLDLKKAFDKSQTLCHQRSCACKGWTSASRVNPELSLVTDLCVVQAVSFVGSAWCQSSSGSSTGSSRASPLVFTMLVGEIWAV